MGGGLAPGPPLGDASPTTRGGQLGSSDPSDCARPPRRRIRLRRPWCSITRELPALASRLLFSYPRVTRRCGGRRGSAKSRIAAARRRRPSTPGEELLDARNWVRFSGLSPPHFSGPAAPANLAASPGRAPLVGSVAGRRSRHDVLAGTAERGHGGGTGGRPVEPQLVQRHERGVSCRKGTSRTTAAGWTALRVGPWMGVR